MGPTLEVRHLVKRFGGVIAVEDVSFQVPAGAFLSLLGPSGSGKSTILRLIGGFEPPDHGVIEIAGIDVSREPPYRRDIGFVFQRYALFPHMTVAENVGFSLKQRGVRHSDRRARVNEMLCAVGLPDCGDRRPGQLSGGQQQRVALARALAFQPRVLIMDEPLGALDREMREHLQHEIRSLQRSLEITTVHVTHDHTEALAMSDYIAVLVAGRIEQLGTPRALYDRPRTEFIARTIAGFNLLRGSAVCDRPGSDAMRLADGTVLRYVAPETRTHAKTVTLMVRPDRIQLEAPRDISETQNVLSGHLLEVVYRGQTYDYRIMAGDQEIVVREQNRTGFTPAHPGSPITLSWAVSDTFAL